MSAPSRLALWSKRFIIGLIVGYGLLTIDWRPKRVSGPPTVVETLHAAGPLKAGAALVSIVPPFPTPIGGYSTRGSAPFEGVADELGARALVVEVGGHRLGFVSVELVVLPAPLREKVRAAVADLKLDELFIAATHTHSGVGGYWDRRIASLLGLGGYDPKAEAFLVSQLSTALHQAAVKEQPARIATGHIEASNYQINRDDQSIEPDKQLTGIRIDGLDGQRIARIVIYAVHPTITAMDSMKLSGDWPAAMMTLLEADGGPTLFFQGALGDVTWGKRQGDMSREERAQRFGHAIAGDARAALGAGGEGVSDVSLSLARVRVNLPPADASPVVWLPFERMTSNLLHWLMWPGTTEVSYLKLGPVTLAMLPGELVSRLGREWRPLLGGATIVSLVDDYVGYIETPELIERKQNEAQRSYFGPSLAPVLLEGLQTARTAAGP